MKNEDILQYCICSKEPSFRFDGRIQVALSFSKYNLEEQFKYLTYTFIVEAQGKKSRKGNGFNLELGDLDTMEE
ncbi:hypothetical protein TSUD_28580 [Trifolium subterraneum]|uniref:Uncharacterized protein n=1 Tax=Trifolium subterraneum TaxID=3900 RepID=A0A2Z6P560_TRISU|nr:hypothetical protein TSUD_28580 [Trifolium subterraneum]